jgi:hypothetical protein
MPWSVPADASRAAYKVAVYDIHSTAQAYRNERRFYSACWNRFMSTEDGAQLRR